MVSRHIQNETLQDVLSFHPLRLGANPLDAPIASSICHFLENQYGVWQAAGGPSAITTGLAKLLEELGGEIHLNSEVGEVLTSGRRASGIRLLDGRILRADAVIAACDPAFLYTSLIRPGNRKVNSDGRYSRAQYSSSVFVISIGTSKRFTSMNLLPHNFIWDGRLAEICHDIFHKKVIPRSLFLHLNIPSFQDPSLAPEGCETIQIVSSVPNLESGTDWSTLALPYRDQIIQLLEKNHLPGLKSAVIAEQHLDPADIQSVFNNCRGSAFSMHFDRDSPGWSYPSHRSEDFTNLYLVGDGTSPGPGLPGVLTSAKITTRLIEGCK